MLNGTSASNKIVLSSLVAEDDLVLFDRNNHKAAHHGALFLGGVVPGVGDTTLILIDLGAGRNRLGGGRRDRGLDVVRRDADRPGGLVGQQRDQLVGQAAEGGRVGAVVTQSGELVGDQRVVGDVDAHGENLRQ